MSTITVQCPGCQSKLNAPPAAAGKKVKCPKCAQMLTVPAGDDFEVIEEEFETVDDDFEVVDDAPKKPAKPRRAAVDDDDDDRPRKPAKKRDDDDDDVRPSKGSKKRAVVDDDDDDEDDYDDRPKKKKGKKKSGSSSGSKMPLLIGVGVVAAIVIAAGAYFALKGGKLDPATANWTKFEAPDGSFIAQFPGGAPSTADVVDILTINSKNANTGEIGRIREELNQAKTVGIELEAWSRSEGKRRYSVCTMKFPDAVAKMLKPDQIMQGMVQGAKQGITKSGGKEKLFFEKSVTVAGQPAQQMGAGLSEKSKPMQVVTYFVVNGRVFIVIVDGDELTEGDEMLAAFLGKFELGGGGAAPADGPKGPIDRGRGPRR